MKRLIKMALLLLPVLLVFGSTLDAHARTLGCSKECRCTCTCRLYYDIGATSAGTTDLWTKKLHVDGDKDCNFFGKKCGKCYVYRSGWDKAEKLCKERNEKDCKKECLKKAKEKTNYAGFGKVVGFIDMTSECKK